MPGSDSDDDRPAVISDDGIGCGEPDPPPLLLGREVGVEDPGEVLRGDPHARCRGSKPPRNRPASAAGGCPGPAPGRCRAAIATVPPCGIAWTAFRTMFWTTCAIWPSSASTAVSAPSMSSRHPTRDPLSENFAALSITGRRDKTRLSGLPPLENVSSWVVRPTDCRSALLRLLEHAERGRSRAETLLATEMQPKMLCSRLLKSWAIPPASRPIASSLLRLEALLLEHSPVRDVGDEPGEAVRAVEPQRRGADVRLEDRTVLAQAGELGVGQLAAGLLFERFDHPGKRRRGVDAAKRPERTALGACSRASGRSPGWRTGTPLTRRPRPGPPRWRFR